MSGFLNLLLLGKIAIYVGLFEVCFLSEIAIQTAVIRLDKSSRNFRRRETSRAPVFCLFLCFVVVVFFLLINDRKKIK